VNLAPKREFEGDRWLKLGRVQGKWGVNAPLIGNIRNILRLERKSNLLMNGLAPADLGRNIAKSAQMCHRSTLSVASMLRHFVISNYVTYIREHPR